MIRQRVSTLFTTFSLLLSLTALSVAVPAATLAATPTVATGYGSEAVPLTGTGAQPTTVTPGARVQFSLWARNDDPSTISQFFLTESLNRTIYSAAWSSSDGSSGTCPTTVPLTCSFGQVTPGESIDAVIVLQTTTTGASMPVNFVWSTVGIGHGDSYPSPDSVGLNGTGNFKGRFLVSGDLLTVGNVESLSASNKQSTVVTSPQAGIGVSVQDGSDVLSACVPVTKCFGETSEIHVGNGSSQYGQFKVVVSLHSSEIPNGINANNLKVYHDGVQITTICASTPVADCYSVQKFKWGLQVTIWLLQNGKLNMG